MHCTVTFPVKIQLDSPELTVSPCSSDKGLAHLRHKLAADYPAVQLAGWRLWPAAAMFNYKFVPLNLRVLFLNMVALGWCAHAVIWPVRVCACGSI